ncbi:MAG: VOC family protein [bacterium]|nr:VOC family protein [bacterium]
MKLAKSCVDIALFTGTAQPMLDFWQGEVGLPYEEPLATGGGNLQHRHDLCGSVLKLNHARDGVPDAPAAGYRELWIARSGTTHPRQLADPDGNRVVLVPPGTEGVDQIAIRMQVRSAPSFEHWFGDVLGFEALAPGCFRCGETLFFFEESPDATLQTGIRGPGYRYLTIQVWSCDDEHRGVLERGGTEGMPPRTHGDVARFSMVCDPDGNWVELSQRASLTGPLPK